jgi:hypothetical protein
MSLLSHKITVRCPSKFDNSIYSSKLPQSFDANLFDGTTSSIISVSQNILNGCLFAGDYDTSFPVVVKQNDDEEYECIDVTYYEIVLPMIAHFSNGDVVEVTRTIQRDGTLGPLHIVGKEKEFICIIREKDNTYKILEHPYLIEIDNLTFEDYIYTDKDNQQIINKIEFIDLNGYSIEEYFLSKLIITDWLNSEKKDQHSVLDNNHFNINEINNFDVSKIMQSSIDNQ